MITNVSDVGVGSVLYQCTGDRTGWNMQSPMSNMWGRGPSGVYVDNRLYPMRDPTVPCYNNGTFIDTPGQLRPHYFAQRPYPQPQSMYAPQMMQPAFHTPIVNDLPCHQQNQQMWDYNMCYDVDGQPCQYTNVVDLEDFM